jgi:hypothetical protein
MRRSSERVATTSGTKPAVYIIHVAEISAPFPNPSSVTASSSSSHYCNVNHSQDEDKVTSPFSPREQGSPRKNSLNRDDISQSSSNEATRENSDNTDKRMKRDIKNDGMLDDEVVENAPHIAWYRITYKVSRNCNSWGIRKLSKYWKISNQ